MRFDLRWRAPFSLLTLALFAAACSGSVERIEPLLSIDGAELRPDPTGRADFALSFGEVSVGVERRVETTFTNQGGAPLQLSTGNLPSPFRSNLTDLSLAPGETRTVWFSFSPLEEGEAEGTIQLRTNEPQGQKSLRLAGRAHPTSVACEPSRIELPPVVRGESRKGTVTCTNLLTSPTTLSLGAFQGKHRALFDASFGDERQIELEGGASATFEIVFAPDLGREAGAVGGSVSILEPSGRVLADVHVETAVQGQALEILVERDGAKSPIDGCHVFATTALGDQTEERFFVRNWSQQPVQLASVTVEGDPSTFSLAAPGNGLPRSLAGNGAEDHEVEVGFHPTSKGTHSGHLVATSDDPLEPAGGVRACFEGQGGGAVLSCIQSQIDFDDVAIGTTVHRTLRCTNASTDGAILHVLGATTSDPARFTAQVLGSDGQPGPDPLGYLPGEGFSVQIAYAPQAEVTDTALLTLDTTATGLHEYALAGRGRNLPPCLYELDPPQLRFGEVAPGNQITLVSTLRNRLSADCVVSNVRLSPATSSAFHMEELEGAVVPANGKLPIEVTFAPTNLDGSHTGEVLFSVSHPGNPHGTIPLTGSAGEPCLAIDPSFLDFGKAPPQCSTGEMFVSIQNTCLVDVTLEDVTIEGEYFEARSVPLLPRTLGPTERVEVSVAFQPEETGPSFGSLAIEASSGGSAIGPFVVPLEGEGDLAAEQTDTFLGEAAPKVDFLLVMDNSPGVDALQGVFHHNLGRMFQFAADNGIDFQLGITTTGVSYAPASGCPGGFNGNEDGRLFPAVSLGRPRILHSGMPRQQLMDDLAANLNVGHCHGAEAAYEAARRALSPPRITTPLADNGNQGFLRRGAALSILIATEEDDLDSIWNGDLSEDRSVERYVRFFQSLKPSWDRQAVKVHAVSGGRTKCAQALACPRCVEGTELTDGVWANFCRSPGGPTWEDDFDAISEAVYGRPAGYRLRGIPGDRNTDGQVDHLDIDVKVDGRVVPGVQTSGVRAWRYDAATNSVVFARGFRPGSNQVVEIHYEVGCVSPG